MEPAWTRTRMNFVPVSCKHRLSYFCFRHIKMQLFLSFSCIANENQVWKPTCCRSRWLKSRRSWNTAAGRFILELTAIAFVIENQIGGAALYNGIPIGATYEFGTVGGMCVVAIEQSWAVHRLTWCNKRSSWTSQSQINFSKMFEAMFYLKI